MASNYALGSFSKDGIAAWPGVIQQGRVIPLADILPAAPDSLYAIFADWAKWDPMIAGVIPSDSEAQGMAEDTLTAHLPYLPENLYGAGANYRKHVMDLIIDHGAGGVGHLSHDERVIHAAQFMDERAATGKPFAFVAPRVAIGGPDVPLVLPYDQTEPDWELELAVVIGKPARRVKAEDALSYVAGYTIANDITARELVDRPDIPQMGMDWLACKGAPGSKILGPYITPARFVPDPQDLHIRLSLNGKVMQDEGTNDMIFTVARIISFISDLTLLNPGDVIMTGSPSGNGTHYGRFLRGGDEVVGEILGLTGKQIVHCVAEKAD